MCVCVCVCVMIGASEASPHLSDVGSNFLCMYVCMYGTCDPLVGFCTHNPLPNFT